MKRILAVLTLTLVVGCSTVQPVSKNVYTGDTFDSSMTNRLAKLGVKAVVSCKVWDDSFDAEYKLANAMGATFLLETPTTRLTAAYVDVNGCPRPVYIYGDKALVGFLSNQLK